MYPSISEIIERDFPADEIEVVRSELLAVNLSHVMAESEYNLNNTHHSILFLAKGDLEAFRNLVASAKRDFRDVIMWATEERKDQSP